LICKISAIFKKNLFASFLNKKQVSVISLKTQHKLSD